MQRRRAVVACGSCARLLVAVALGCDDPQLATHERFALELRAVSTSGEPVAGVRFWADGNDLGVSNGAGTLRVDLPGRAGQRVTLTSACPATYRTVTPRRRVVLQHLAPFATSQAAAPPQAAVELQVQSACEPIERRAVVVVRARASGPLAGVPIHSDGELIGQTGLDGSAHLLIKTRPGASLRIALDTSAWPELLPSHPLHSYQLGDEDSIVLVDQTFARRQLVREPRQPVRHAPTPVVHAPYRIR